jgi:hypothetical protein
VARKIKKEARQSKKLWKEVRPGEVEERQMEELWKMRRQERLASQRLSEREAQRERSPQEVGQEGEGVDVREEEADMNLEEEREDSAPMTGKIGNPAEETAPVEENETPQIKENCPEASGTSPESPIPQVSSIQVVSSILPSHASSVPVQLVSQSHQEVRVQGGYWDPLVDRKQDH